MKLNQKTLIKDLKEQLKTCANRSQIQLLKQFEVIERLRRENETLKLEVKRLRRC